MRERSCSWSLGANMEKNSFEKLKDNLPDFKQFARKYISESATIIALLVGGLSAWKHLVFGGIGITLLFLVIGTALGIFWPVQIDTLLKKFYQLSYKRNRTSEMIVGGIEIVVAFLFPFVFFAMIGMLAGSAYHYFTRLSQSSGSKGSKAA